jgi:hypothetical protein
MNRQNELTVASHEEDSAMRNSVTLLQMFDRPAHDFLCLQLDSSVKRDPRKTLKYDVALPSHNVGCLLAILSLAVVGSYARARIP